MSKEEREQRREEAKKTLDSHEYTLLTEGNGCEVWKCSQPDSNSYAFNIAILPMGISIVGDIGELTFNVYGRGMDFLAGDDVDYYIHSKLSVNCKEKQYDAEHIKVVVASEVKYDFIESEKHFDLFSEDEMVKIQDEIKDLDFRGLQEYFENKYYETDPGEKHHQLFSDLNDFLEDVKMLSYVQEAFNLLNECEVVNFADDMDYSFEKPNEGLINTLYLINEASRNIMKLKKV